MEHFDIRVTGLVQGVGFRYFTKREALRNGVTGFVKNEWDGSVYIEAEGEPAQLKEFTDNLRIGPWSADVKSVSVQPGPLKFFNDFTINF